MHIPKWLIAIAALVLVVLIAAVAFFAGRGTSQPSAQAPTSVTDTAPAPEPSVPPVTETSAAPAAPATPSSSAAAPTSPAPTAAGASPSSATAPSVAVDTQAADGARERVSAYFKQMETLQSAGPGGDPEAFARTLIQGAVSGDFSGIDDLVRAAGDAERRAVALQPPGECAEYHAMAVTLLQESRTMVTALRDGLKRNDTDTLAALGATAQSLKSRADTLAAAEQALRARFGL